jgi:hypothetical protein
VAEGVGVLTAVATGTTEDTAEVAEGTTEDAAVDTALPAACATRTGAEGVPWADPDGAPGSGGSCAAAAGRAKITVRIRPIMKVTARPPQAQTQTRRDRMPDGSIPLHSAQA